MATKDIGQGWGDLPRSLTEWKCPACAKNYPVENWQIVLSEIRGIKMDGRKCPVCEFVAYQTNETRQMDPVIRTFDASPTVKKTKKKHG